MRASSSEHDRMRPRQRQVLRVIPGAAKIGAMIIVSREGDPGRRDAVVRPSIEVDRQHLPIGFVVIGPVET